jgi:hypothetical protein
VKDLPKFKARSREHVMGFISGVLTQPNKPTETYFRRLVEYEDGHYGAEFSLSYFASAEVPTKSQWNSLKKKLKRHDKKAFVFKEHRIIPCDDATGCGFLEFGFFVQ